MDLKTTSKFRIVFVIIALLYSVQFSAQITTIAQWSDFDSIPSSGQFLAKDGIFGNKDRAILTREFGNTATFNVVSDKRASSNQWQNNGTDKYWTVTLSTVGYKNIKVWSRQVGSNTGPSTFKLQYKTGALWVDVPGGNATISATTSPAVMDSIPLPANLEDDNYVTLRWLCDTTFTAGINNPTVTAAGVNRIEIFVYGEAKPLPIRSAIKLNTYNLYFTQARPSAMVKVTGDSLMANIDISSDNPSFTVTPTFLPRNAVETAVFITYDQLNSAKGRIKFTSGSVVQYLDVESCAGAECLDNTGSEDSPYTIQEARRLQGQGYGWVKGYIIGCVEELTGDTILDPVKYNETNIALGSDLNGTEYLAVHLTSAAMKTYLNLKTNRTNVGKLVQIYGKLDNYSSVEGLTSTDKYKFTTGTITVDPKTIGIIIGDSALAQVTGSFLTEDIKVISNDETIFKVTPSIISKDARSTEIKVIGVSSGTAKLTLESGDLKEEVTVNCWNSPDASLKTLVIGKDTIKLEKDVYEYIAKDVTYEADTVMVIAIPTNDKALVVIGNGKQKLNIGANTIKIEIQAQSGVKKIYTIDIFRSCDPPVVIKQVMPDTVCAGSDYTFAPVIKGSGLKYQWYFENKIIQGATDSVYKITNVQDRNDGYYQVQVIGTCGSLNSDNSRLRVIDPLPAELKFVEKQDTAYIGKTYKFQIGNLYDYKGVTYYKWSYSNANASFDPAEGATDYFTNVTFGPSAVSGTITVELDHVCGKRRATHNIRVMYPTSISEVENAAVTLYPNPVQSELFVESASPILSFTVVDMNGRIVESGKGLSDHSLQIRTDAWRQGNYLISIVTASGMTTHKVTKN